MIRARAGVSYALTEAMDDGHCGLPREQLLAMAGTLLEVPAAIIETALDLELRDGEVVADTVDDERCIFLAGLHRAESAIAARIKMLSAGALPWRAIDAAKAIPWVESKAGIILAASQREAVQLALTTKVLSHGARVVPELQNRYRKGLGPLHLVSQFDPRWRVVAGLLPAADLAVDTRSLQARGDRRAKQQRSIRRPASRR